MDTKEDTQRATRAMCDAIRHRGPDSEGLWIDRDANIALGHRRLSILELTPAGAQPMHSSCGRWTISFNGEIYNFSELKRRLTQTDREWRGHSDTEVLLEAFSAWGVDATLQAIAGMYAFALWDRTARELHLVRDRLGEKPLYAGTVDNVFVFGSELKALRAYHTVGPRVRRVAVMSLLQRGYVSGPDSIYAGIARVPPGGHLVVRRNGERFEQNLSRYWTVDAILAKPRFAPASMDALADELDTILRQVVTEEVVADVPVGAFLSGGIDSSLIVATMQQVSSQPVRTFTVAFDDVEFDESRYARSVAEVLGTQHTEVRLSADDALQMIDLLPELYDEPFADSSQLPTLLVSRAIRESVAVALSGDAGDELFGGYPHYQLIDTIARVTRRAPSVSRPALSALLSATPTWLFDALFRERSTWGRNARARLLNGLHGLDERREYEELMARWVDPQWLLAPALRNGDADHALAATWPISADATERRMAYDLQTYLPDDVMVKVDRAAMAWSLETRAPFLHHELVEFALRVPVRYKIFNGRGKLLLRHLLSRHLPPALFERPKRGFAVPLEHWLRGPLKVWGEIQLADDTVLRSWLDANRVRRVWREHQSGKVNHSERLWPILILMQWIRRTDAKIE